MVCVGGTLAWGQAGHHCQAGHKDGTLARGQTGRPRLGGSQGFGVGQLGSGWGRCVLVAHWLGGRLGSRACRRRRVGNTCKCKHQYRKLPFAILFLWTFMSRAGDAVAWSLSSATDFPHHLHLLATAI